MLFEARVLVAVLVGLLRLLILKFLAVLLGATVFAAGRVVFTCGAARPDLRATFWLFSPLCVGLLLAA